MKRKLTKKEVFEVCAEFWPKVVKEESKHEALKKVLIKRKWLTKEETVKVINDVVACSCPACEFVRQQKLTCFECPFKELWLRYSENGTCYSENGMYRQWVKFFYGGESEKAKKLAKEIAEFSKEKAEELKTEN